MLKNIINKLITNNEQGVVLITLMLLSMMMLALGLTMLYQSETNFKLSALSRDQIEVFMAAETGYESCVNRMIYNMDTVGYEDSFRSAWPGDSDGWPNYLIRVYDNPSNPTHFRLVEQPSIDFWENDTLNRDLSSAVDVTNDNNNSSFFLITRSDSLGGGDVFKIDDTHFYRAWIEADRYQDNSPIDRTAFLMVEAFRGKPNAPIDPSDPNFLPQSHVLMQYRIKLMKYTMVYESGDTSQYGEGAAGTGATWSSERVDITVSDGTRKVTESSEES